MIIKESENKMKEKIKEEKKGKLYGFSKAMCVITKIFRVIMIISLVAVSIALLLSPVYINQIEKKDTEQYIKELQDQLKNYSITVKNEANAEENYEIKGNELSKIFGGKDISKMDTKEMLKNLKVVTITVLISAIIVLACIIWITNKFIEFFKNIMEEEKTKENNLVTLKNANILKEISKRLLIFQIMKIFIEIIYVCLNEFKSYTFGFSLEPFYVLTFIYIIALIFEKEAKKRDTIIEEEVIKEEVIEENN